MYQEILNNLKTKFAGVQETILIRIAKKIAETVTNADEAKTAVDGITFQQVLESYGDSRATDATKTAVQNYEKKHGIKDGKPIAKQSAEPDNAATNEEIPEWAKTLMDSVKGITTDIAQLKGDKLNTSRKSRLAEILKDVSADVRRGYERIPLTGYSDDEFETFLTDVGEEVKTAARQDKQKGAVFGKPTTNGSRTTAGTGTTQASKEEVDAVVAQMNI